MSEPRDQKVPTHNAYALKRETRVSGRWLDIGNARLEVDHASLPENLKHLIPHLPQLLKALRGHVFLDRTPIGGFNGDVYIAPIGVRPEDPRPQPQRPSAPSSEDDEF